MTELSDATVREAGSSLLPLLGGGETGRRIAELDWTDTPLGPLRSWSATLRTAVGICVTARQPMAIWWGPEFILLHNDALIPMLGPSEHPALGRPGELVWPQMWHVIGRQLRDVLASGNATTGNVTASDDHLLPTHRLGCLEEAYFTCSNSPIHAHSPIPSPSPVQDVDGQVAGVLTAFTETTGRVLGERRMRTLRELADAAAVDTTTVEKTCAAAVAALAGNRADVPFARIHLLDANGDPAPIAAVGIEADRPIPAVTAAVGQALDTGVAVDTSGLAASTPGLVRPGHSHVGNTDVDMAVSIPLITPGQDRPLGVLVVGISPYRRLDEDYRGFLDLVADQVAGLVTAVRTFEAQRRRTEALAELDRARTKFFSGVSDELRTPLTLISAPAHDALTDDAHPLPPAQRDRLELISRNSGRLRRFVDTMLDFARLEGGHLVPERRAVDLAELTRGIAESFGPAARRAGLEFVVDCPDQGEPAVLVDPDMWEKIVLNLLSNAVKYTLEGRVTVALRPAQDGAVRLEVADTGVGIPPADLPRVFERFHRVRGVKARSCEGAGIGLALVARLVALHEGTVTVDSTPGAGSTFTVSLPASARTDELPEGGRTASSVGPFLDEAMRWSAGRSDGAEIPEPVETGDTAGARVLVAQNDPDLREFIASLLRPHYTVLVAADGARALRLARTRRVDLLVADVMMPELDGFELLAAVRAHPTTARLPVILLSARAGEVATAARLGAQGLGAKGLGAEGLGAGADDFLTKPFSSQELIARVRSNLELARLRNRESTWRAAVITALQDGFLVIDSATRSIVEINPAITEMLGLGGQHLPCRPPYPYLPTQSEDPDDFALQQKICREVREQSTGNIVLPLRHIATRERVWVSVSFSRLDDPARHRQLIIATMSDVTAARRQADHATLLAEAGRALAQPTDLTTRLTRIAEIAAPVVADLAMISIIGPDGKIAPVAVADRHDKDLARRLMSLSPRTIPPQVLQRLAAGDAFVMQLTDAMVRASSDKAGLATLMNVDMRSAIVAPLRADGELLGSLSLISTSRSRRHDAADLALVEELGRHIARAVDMDRAGDREHRLQATTSALAAAATLMDAAKALAAGVRDTLGADAVGVYRVEPDEQHLRLVHSLGYPEIVAARFGAPRLDEPLPVTDAARTGQGVWLRGPEDRARYPRLAGNTALTGHRAATAVPLMAGGRAVGAITASFMTDRTFFAHERDFVLALAGQAALAFERAQLADQRSQVAHTLQRALLPSALPAVEGLDLAARYLPALQHTQAGGDWYDVFQSDGNRVALVVGDVVGQGPAAAAVMGQLRSVLSAHLHDGHSPAAALELLDRFARRTPAARGSTAMCLMLDTATGEIRWASAGHLPPLLVTHEGNRFLAGGEGTLLGVSGRAPFAEAGHTLRAGDSVALYTDGLVERRGEVVDTGLARLVAAARPELAPDALAQALLRQAQEGAGAADDIAIVVARLLPVPLRLRLPARPESLADLRRAVRGWTAAAGLSEDAVGDLQLAVGEAAANAVEHAYAVTGGDFSCEIGRATGGGIDVVVADHGRWRPPPPDAGYRGRGLKVIAAISADVHLERSAEGTRIAFQLPAMV